MTQKTIDQCEICPANPNAKLVQLGPDTNAHEYVIALAGNPNVGKSTVFNQLTGLRQHTGNWPGKTVSRAEGAYSFDNKRYKVIDLPGTYSLLSTSTDEEIARDFILFGQPDVTVVVVDATRLTRNLNLVLQILDITDRVVVNINLIDEAQRMGISIDARGLSRELGVPVVLTAARSGEGMPELLREIAIVATGRIQTKPFRFATTSRNVQRGIDRLSKMIHRAFPSIPNVRWIALRLLEGDQSIIDAIRLDELGLLETLREKEERVRREGAEYGQA